MTWAVRYNWRFEAIELVKETDKTVLYVDRGWNNRQTRIDKSKLLPWRGDEETARAIVEKLKSAKAEYDRRAAAASAWYKARQAEIFASAGESRKAETDA